jgi:outer membrane receptor protein involved in Fe transport
MSPVISRSSGRRSPSNPAAGTIPFHRRYITPTDVTTVSARDRDIAFYVQDAWRPVSRLTATIGIRIDMVRRYDRVNNFAREDSAAVGPRFGVSYLSIRFFSSPYALPRKQKVLHLATFTVASLLPRLFR